MVAYKWSGKSILHSGRPEVALSQAAWSGRPLYLACHSSTLIPFIIGRPVGTCFLYSRYSSPKKWTLPKKFPLLFGGKRLAILSEHSQHHRQGCTASLVLWYSSKTIQRMLESGIHSICHQTMGFWFFILHHVVEIATAVNMATFLRHSLKTISRPVALSQVIRFRFWPKDIFKCELYPKRKSTYVYSRLWFQRKKSKDRLWGLLTTVAKYSEYWNNVREGAYILEATGFISRAGARKKALKGAEITMYGEILYWPWRVY